MRGQRRANAVHVPTRACPPARAAHVCERAHIGAATPTDAHFGAHGTTTTRSSRTPKLTDFASASVPVIAIASPSPPAPPPSRVAPVLATTTIIIIIAASGGGGLLCIIAGVAAWRCRRRGPAPNDKLVDVEAPRSTAEAPHRARSQVRKSGQRIPDTPVASLAAGARKQQALSQQGSARREQPKKSSSRALQARDESAVNRQRSSSAITARARSEGDAASSIRRHLQSFARNNVCGRCGGDLTLRKRSDETLYVRCVECRTEATPAGVQR